MKHTIMWYEKDFTIPVFCKKVRFDYDENTGDYIGKFKISNIFGTTKSGRLKLTVFKYT